MTWTVEDAKRHAKIKRLRGETKNGPKKKIGNRSFAPTPPDYVSPLSKKYREGMKR